MKKNTKKKADGLTPAELAYMQERAMELWHGERSSKAMTELEDIMVELREHHPSTWKRLFDEIQLDMDLEAMQYD